VGALARARPRQKVAIHENTCTALGTATAKLAADTRCMVNEPSPAVNMWCTHSAKLSSPTPSSAATTQR